MYFDACIYTCNPMVGGVNSESALHFCHLFLLQVHLAHREQVELVIDIDDVEEVQYIGRMIHVSLILYIAYV